MVLTKRGFSLIELVVVVGLLSLLMLAISSTMLMSVVSSRKLKTVTKVKQTGNYILGQIETMLRSAKSIDTCDSAGTTITFVNQDGGTTQIITELDDAGVTRISSNSGIYLTPDSVETNTFELVCAPSDAEPRIVKVSFDLRSTINTESSQNLPLHFETSVNLRNE